MSPRAPPAGWCKRLPRSEEGRAALQRRTEENLTALRELALMRVADQVDDALLSRWTRVEAPETRERVLVCVSQPDVAEDLVRRGPDAVRR
jgi:K+-sensing histidine kinase KdpD